MCHATLRALLAVSSKKIDPDQENVFNEIVSIGFLSDQLILHFSQDVLCFKNQHSVE